MKDEMMQEEHMGREGDASMSKNREFDKRKAEYSEK